MATPTVALNTPADVATGQSTTPTLEFTGTDADNDAISYQVQVDAVNTFDSGADIHQYPVSGINSQTIYGGSVGGRAVTLKGKGSGILSVQWYLSKNSSPTGSAFAKVYSTTGEYGTTAIPTGTALAVSDPFDVSTLTSTQAYKTFNFTGIEQIVLERDVVYAVTFEYTGGSASNNVSIRSSNTGDTSNSSYFYTGSWQTTGINDTPVIVTGEPTQIINAISELDTGFADITTPATTDPFTSGDQVGYTVQAGDTLSSGTYYWRVRGKDPSGSNTFGAWATTRSFTTNTPPTTALTTPTNATTLTTDTPALTFAATDTDSDAVSYQVQVSKDASFATTHTDAVSTVATGWSGTDPYTSGASVTYTLQTALNKGAVVYNWRARAKDPLGTNTFGAWTANRSMTTEGTRPTTATGTAGSITLTGATISGSTVTNTTPVTITERGIAYALTASPVTNDNKTTGTGSPFNVSLTSLSNDTTYYARSYIIWSEGTVYGSQISFKTQGKASVVLNLPASAGEAPDVRSKLEFTGTDSDNNRISYQLQLNTSNSFTSPILDVLSSANAGFLNTATVNTDPFFSGDKIRYTSQTDLTRGTDYYWRVRGKDPSGSNTFGVWTTSIKFTVAPILASLTVTTIHDVLDTSAQADATIASDGGATITEQGIVYSTTTAPTTANSKVITTGTSYTASITGLTGSTLYYVRAYAINSKGTAYSNQISFTTDVPLTEPILTTGATSFLTDETVYLAGEVTSDGSRDITERGIVFSTGATPTTADGKVTTPGTIGTYSINATGLVPSTTYYYRAYAINAVGTGYGSILSFTTLAPFVPDEGDGYWIWSPGRSQATIGRTQATAPDSSINLPLADLGLIDGNTYTFAIGDVETTNGIPSIVIERFDVLTPIQDTVAANSSFTFTYDETLLHWNIRVFVSGADAIADNIAVILYDVYLAEEASFSGFVPFTRKGIYEVKITNNEIIDKRRLDVIDSLYDSLLGIEYYPFNIDTEGLGWFETGDRFTIKDSEDVEQSVVMFNSKLTMDGGIQENIHTDITDSTLIDYSRAGNVRKDIKNAQIIVDKQAQTITSITSDLYQEGGYLDGKLSEVYQDIDGVRTTVQGAGGVNLIKNSVMYAYDSEGYPDNWNTYGLGPKVSIEASPESLSAGAVSGNAWTISDQKTAKQTVTVRKDVDLIPQDEKTYYSFSARIKKDIVGAAYITLSNRNETLTIDLPDQTSYYWQNVTLEGLLPKDDHYEILFYTDYGALIEVTDVILSPGESRHEWTQASGEMSNTSVAITESGMTVRSAQFKKDFTKTTALGFEVHKNNTEVFGFNGDETNVEKLKVNSQIAMPPLMTVPIDYGTLKGWAFVIKEII